MLGRLNRLDLVVDVRVRLLLVTLIHITVLLLLHLQAQKLLILQVGPPLHLDATGLHGVHIDQVLNHLVMLSDALLLDRLHLSLQALQGLALHRLLAQ